MRRLTDSYEKYSSTWPKEMRGKGYSLESCVIVEKLGAYEDLHDNGKLLVLPCKRGDTVWRIIATLGGEIIIKKGIIKDIMISIHEESMTQEFYFVPEGSFSEVMHYQNWISFDEFGKSVFVDYEKAKEEFLKQRRNVVAVESNDEDVCTWNHSEKKEGLFIPDCTNDEDDALDWLVLRHFKYCPYCRKKIDVRYND